VAQSVKHLMVKHLTLDFGLGHDLRVMRSSPLSGSLLGVEPAWDSLSTSPSAPSATSKKSFVLLYLFSIFLHDCVSVFRLATV